MQLGKIDIILDIYYALTENRPKIQYFSKIWKAKRGK